MTQESTGPLADRPQWTYWVAYGHRGGVDAVAVSTAEPLTTVGRVVEMATRIGRDAGIRNVAIVSWQLLSGPDDAAWPTAAKTGKPADTAPAEPEPVDASASTGGGAEARVEPAGPVERRVALVRGLRELAEVLEANPGMPAPEHVSADWYARNTAPDMTEAAAVAAVDRAAEALGMPVLDSLSKGHYAVGPKAFGPRPIATADGLDLPAVSYSAVYISAEASAKHKAARLAAERASTGGGER
jgi:hypothetical protein